MDQENNNLNNSSPQPPPIQPPPVQQPVEPPTQSEAPKSSGHSDGSKKTYWIIGVAVALGLLWYFSSGLNKDTDVVSSEEETAAINDIGSEIDAIDLGDLDEEFEAIDQDLNSL